MSVLLVKRIDKKDRYSTTSPKIGPWETKGIATTSFSSLFSVGEIVKD